MLTQPFSNAQQALEDPDSPEPNVSRWVFTFYTDNQCVRGAHRQSDTRSKSCTNINSVASVAFDTGGQKFILQVYPKKGCVGVSRSFNTDTDCTSITAKVQSYKILG